MSKGNNNHLRKKIKMSEVFPEEMKVSLKNFVVTTFVSFFPFLVCFIVSFFNEPNLLDIFKEFDGYFRRSDMLIFIISFTITSALTNVFFKNFRLNIATIGCWIVILFCAVYFCSFDSDKVQARRVFGVFLIALILSILNIFIQGKKKREE